MRFAVFRGGGSLYGWSRIEEAYVDEECGQMVEDCSGGKGIWAVYKAVLRSSLGVWWAALSVGDLVSVSQRV